MPDILPTINNEPAQGIQALLDTVYLWNPDVANNLIEQVNELLEELGELSNVSGAIKPYSQLEVPVRQYMPMSYNDGVYVANEEMTELPATPDLSKWTLIATKVDEQALEQQISRAVGGEADLRRQADNTLQGNIDAEERARIAADQGLQTQIDAISAASDVKDIVGTYQELENYDTSKLGDNDIIKVLQDETQEDATTYYRWVAAEDEFQLIGEEGPYYTRAQTDAMLEEKQDIMQFSTMPEADASNANKVIQYVGEDIPESPASAVVTQTVGSGLSNLSVDLNTFVETEQPSGAETVTFTCTASTISFTDNPRTSDGITIAIDESVFLAKFAQLQTGIDITTAQMIAIEWYANEGSSFIDVASVFIDAGSGASWSEEIYRTDPGLEIDKLSEWGVTITGTPEVFQWRGFNFAPAQSTVTWSKNGVEVDISNYGVTYDGSPAVGDTVAVSYAPAVKPVTSGYFYVNTPAYSEPVATIEQTVGTDSISFETTSGDTTISGDIQAFNNLLADIGWTPSDVPSTGTLMFTWYESDGAWFLELQPAGWGDYYAQEFLEQMGFVFTGTPEDGDAITANYHFGLLDLSVDPDTFVEAEQPSGSETVSFVASVTPDSAYVEEQVDPAGWSYIFNAEQFSEEFYQQYGVTTAEIAEGTNPCGIVYNRGPGTWDMATRFGYIENIDLAEWGITIAGTPTSDAAMLRIRGIAGSISWAKDGTTVDIAEYGVSYSGTPDNGDTITVNYTAPYITGYAWEQINVQPGGTGGIKWAGQWDKPASTTWTYYYPHYTFSTLPDGNYEFVVQNKSLYQYSNGIQVWSHKTFKITFGVANHRSRGIAAWVLDGSSDFYSYNMSSIATFTHWSSYYEQNPLDRIVADLVGGCRIGNATMRASNIEGIFRWTNIKNTDTGEEIPVEIDVRQNPTGIDNQIGSYSTGNPVDPPYIPVASTYSEGDCNDSTQYIMFGDPLLPQVHTVAPCGSFKIALKDADGSEWCCVVDSNMHSYVARVLKASGIFVNTQLGWTEGANIGGTCVFLNTPAGTEKTIEMWVSIYGGTVSANCWLIQNVSNFTPVLVTRPGSLVTMDNFGLIEQYTGETDANYTNGYFYKATGTKVNVPESIAITNVTTVGEATITIDLANWIDAIARTYGWTTETIRTWLADYAGVTWNLSCRTDNGEVTRMYLPWYGDTYETDILQYVTATYTGDQHGEIWVEFQEQYTKAHAEVQNGHWERIDVQPAPEALPDQTGNAGKFLTTDGTGTSWSDVTTTKNCYNEGRFQIGGNNSAGLYITKNTTSTDYFVGGVVEPSNVQGGLEIRAVAGYVYQGRSYVFSRTALIPNYLGSSGVIDLGSSGYMWKTVYATKLNNGADISIPTTGGTMAVQVSSLPTAGSTLEGQIYQFVGATDSTYTNGYFYKCVSDGQSPATYSWEEVSFGGGATYTAGNGISIANNEISVAAPTLTNANSTNDSIIITDQNPNTYNVGSDVAIGKSITFGSVGSTASVAIGKETSVGQSTVAIGYQAKVYGTSKTGIIAIGYKSNALGNHCIQLNASGSSATNSDDNTLKVANANGNFEMMSADGTVPTARLTKVNTTATLTVAGWSNNEQTVNVTGMTADGVVLVSPTPANQSAYTSAGILCTAQAAGSLTFTCDTVPSADITVTIVML